MQCGSVLPKKWDILPFCYDGLVYLHIYVFIYLYFYLYSVLLTRLVPLSTAYFQRRPKVVLILARGNLARTPGKFHFSFFFFKKTEMVCPNVCVLIFLLRLFFVYIIYENGSTPILKTRLTYVFCCLRKCSLFLHISTLRSFTST